MYSRSRLRTYLQDSAPPQCGKLGTTINGHPLLIREGASTNWLLLIDDTTKVILAKYNLKRQMWYPRGEAIRALPEQMIASDGARSGPVRARGAGVGSRQAQDPSAPPRGCTAVGKAILKPSRMTSDADLGDGANTNADSDGPRLPSQTMIVCVDCGATRTVAVKNAWQVVRCAECQEAHRRKRRAELKRQCGQNR